MKAHPTLTEAHEAFRDTMRRFVAKEIVPHANVWDEAGEFPREMYRRAAAAGLLGVGFPEEYGGTPADLLMQVVLSEEIALGGSGGKRLVEHQAIRHKLVDMQMRIHAARAMVYDTAYKLMQAPRDAAAIAQLCMTKNFATRTMQFCADEAVQTLGGAGFIRGTRSERVYREVKVMTIGGGAEEIMKDLAARQLGWQ